MQGLLALQRYFDFSGRSARAEYWQFVALALVTLVVAYVLDLAFSGPYATPTLTIIANLGLMIPGWAVAFRRLHDRGRTGWWIGAMLILSGTTLVLIMAAEQSKYTTLGDILLQVSRVPGTINLLLSIFLLIEMVRVGEDGPNRFGLDPLRHPTPAPKLDQIVTRVQAATGEGARQVPARQARPTDEDPIAQLERLAKLKDAGLLTDAEFAEQKAIYLARL